MRKIKCVPSVKKKEIELKFFSHLIHVMQGKEVRLAVVWRISQRVVTQSLQHGSYAGHVLHYIIRNVSHPFRQGFRVHRIEDLVSWAFQSVAEQWRYLHVTDTSRTSWCNGSAADSRSEACVFKSRGSNTFNSKQFIYSSSALVLKMGRPLTQIMVYIYVVSIMALDCVFFLWSPRFIH